MSSIFYIMGKILSVFNGIIFWYSVKKWSLPMFATIIPEDLAQLLRGDLEINNPKKQYQEFLGIGLGGYFCEYLKACDISLMPQMIQKQQQQLYYNTILLTFKDQLKEQMDQRGIRHWFYKGAALVELLYHSSGGRQISDLDLLIHQDDLHKVPDLLKEIGGDYDSDFFLKRGFYHESESAHSYLGCRINLDWHKGLIQNEKFPIDYREFIGSDQIEYQIIALLLHFSNDIYRSSVKNIVDLYLIFTTQNVDYNFLFRKINQFHLRHVAYVVLSRMNKKCALEIDLEVLQMSGWRKKLLDHLILTPVFRINQLLLFFYVFDSPIDFKRFLGGKLKGIQRQGFKEILHSFKTIK